VFPEIASIWWQGGFVPLLILKIIVYINLNMAYASPYVSCPRGEETPMARMLLLDGDAGLWHIVCDVVEREG
jgi:hypothetical protein